MLVLKFLYIMIELPVLTYAKMVNMCKLRIKFYVFRMFLFTEKKYLEGLQRDVDLSLFLPKDEIQFLRQKNRLHQIQSRVKYSTQHFI